MKAYKLSWQKIDWNTYWTIGHNYIIACGEIYATTKEKAMANCPITEKQGKIDIKEIEIIT